MASSLHATLLHGRPVIGFSLGGAARIAVMARARRSSAPASPRAGFRDRHGRGIRAAVTGPHLPLLRSRADLFDLTVASTAEYLKDVWPAELATVTFEVAGLPADLAGTSLDRWR